MAIEAERNADRHPRALQYKTDVIDDITWIDIHLKQGDAKYHHQRQPYQAYFDRVNQANPAFFGD